VAKYKKQEYPDEWFLTEFTMNQVEGRLMLLEQENEELRKKTFLQDAEIDNLSACIKCEKMPEGCGVNDDATTVLAVELAKSQLETSCMVEDAAHKADLLRVATKALEDIRAACISSPYWHNQVSHAPARLQNVTRALLRHHKIATDAQKKIEEMNRAILET
jgi:hypothetical protein